MGLSCNIFIGSYDQIGLYEMDEVCYKTGGVVVMSDSAIHTNPFPLLVQLRIARNVSVTRILV